MLLIQLLLLVYWWFALHCVATYYYMTGLPSQPHLLLDLRSDTLLNPTPQVPGAFGPGGVPHLSGYAMFHHQIKAVHESAHQEDKQRQDQADLERRPRFATRSPTVLDREGGWEATLLPCVCVRGWVGFLVVSNEGILLAWNLLTTTAHHQHLQIERLQHRDSALLLV